MDEALKDGPIDGLICTLGAVQASEALDGRWPPPAVTSRARIRSIAYTANEHDHLARVPARAAAIALDRAGVAIGDVDRIEINEAFASVALQSTRDLGADPERVNVNGGAVALGHPIGASGARLLGTLVHELRRNGGGLGLAAICSGGGQGDATLLEVLPAAA